MHFVRILSASLILFFFANTGYSQSTIAYNEQNLFLNGANLAWLAFAGDIGRGQTDYNSFADIALQMHDHGGNALRWWLHTNGTASPEFNESGLVTGPGDFTISDLKTALDLAWEREVGLILCLWSFDMLRLTNSNDVLQRNQLMLTDSTYLQAYIDNALIPMVDSLKGHPAIIAWEIFNEPEGMTSASGFSGVGQVSMENIQFFVNRCAGAIHRTDPDVLVTNGTHTFATLTDVTISTSALREEFLSMTSIKKSKIEQFIHQKYRLPMTADEMIENTINSIEQGNYNYYRDDRLIEVGGDPDGTLDFYQVHYYNFGTALSPFSNTKASWDLDKPLIVGEFAMAQNDNVQRQDLFITLFQQGYAGALPWSWTDTNISSPAHMLEGMQSIWDNFPLAVDIDGIGGDWPLITLTSPANGAKFSDGEDVVLEAEASDNDGTVAMVEFFASDTLLIGALTEAPYTLTWTDISPNIYTIKAVATDDQGHERVSNKARIQVGTPPTTRLEAEAAQWQGQNGFTPRSDPGASAGSYIEMTTNSGGITWTVRDVAVAGNYEIRFGYRLPFDRPKNQFILVNGVQVAEMVFDSTLNVWFEEPLNVDLVAGDNEIRMELSWGWMDIDYMSIPSGIITSVKADYKPGDFVLQPNYPNPFNPSTTISYNLPDAGQVKLQIFDILGREVSTLVDKQQNAGQYNFSFDGRSLASGTYFYRLQVGNKNVTKRMLLIK